jgi:hypothetical protein
MTRRVSAITLLASLSYAAPAGVPLESVRRIFVERLIGGDTAAHIRDMIVSAIQRSRLFTVTEDQERADAILKGSAEDLVFTDRFYSRDSVQARVSVPVRTGSRTSTPGATIGQAETVRADERKHEAAASVRLVNKAGDVIWATTQESQGGKFRGASADVAEKVMRQLKEDVDRARRIDSVKPSDSNSLPR